MRTRKRTHGGDGEGGQARRGDGRAPAWTTSASTCRRCQLGITLASLGIGFLGEPAIADLIEPLFGDAVSHAVATAIALRHRLRPRDVAAHHGRRAGPEDLRDRQAPSRSRCGSPARCYLVRPRDAAVHRRCSTGVSNWTAARLLPHRRRRRALRGGLDAEGAARAHRPGPRRRQARPGRGGDALRRLPPARAGGAQRHDADPGGRDRRRLRGRRDRAAPLHLLRPHAPARHRGREPRPRARHRPRQLARAAAHDRGRRRVVRDRDPRRADRPRDQAAGRPARRPAAPALLDGRRRRRVRPRRRASSPSRTSSRRSSARSTTRPTRRAARSGAWPTATGTCAATSR